MLYLILKSINPDTSIGVSNLKYEIEKGTLANFVNNVKDLHDDMSAKYSNILDKWEFCEDFFRHIFRSLLSGPKSTLNFFIESTKYDWDTGSEVLEGYIIQNYTEGYNNMVEAKEWTKTDPKDDKIPALITFLYKL